MNLLTQNRNLNKYMNSLGILSIDACSFYVYTVSIFCIVEKAKG